MNKFQNKYRIETSRRPGWDYSSSGYYYITICTKNRECYFGNIMQLSELGEIAHKCWNEIPQHFPFIEFDEYIVMPNHVHGIICINKKMDISSQNNNDMQKQNVMVNMIVETQNIASLRRAPKQPYYNKFGPQSQNLASIIRGFKTGVTKYATMHKINFQWQPRFHDRIIRDERALNNIRQYIINNPKNWDDYENNV